MKNMKRIKTPVSFIIPLHNEEDFLVVQINKLQEMMKKLSKKDYEVILVENGSVDKTYRIAKKMASKDKRIIVTRATLPHYGQAIRHGLLTAKNDPIIQLDLDLIDEKFIKSAIAMYGGYDILVGSKFLGKIDNRSALRKVLSFGLKRVINVLFGYYGTDTHGIKAYKKETVLDLIGGLPMTKHMFDTSIVIAAENRGLKVMETAVDVKEIRPSRFPSTKRIFEAFFDIFILFNHRFNNSVKIRIKESRNYISNLKFPIPFI